VAGAEPPDASDSEDDAVEIPEGAVYIPPTGGFPVRRAKHAGMGLVTGTFITGLSTKVMVTRQHGAQITAGLGWSPYSYWPAAGLGLGADYLFHLPTLFESAPVYFGWHLGVGTSLRVRPEAEGLSLAAGLHGVVGVEVLFRNAPVDLSFAWRPGAIGGIGRARGLSFAYGDITAHVRVWFDARDLDVEP
jgi:hypothetical protein